MSADTGAQPRKIAMPDITKAQALSAFTWLVGQLVTMNVVDNELSKIILSVGLTVIAAAWTVADSLLRGRRAMALAQNQANFQVTDKPVTFG